MVKALHGQRRRTIRGFTLIELMVVILTIVILAAIMIPGFSRAIAKHKREDCVMYLKNVGLSFRTWANDHGGNFPMNTLTNKDGSREIISGSNVFRVFQVISNEIGSPLLFGCPADTRRAVKDFSELKNENISYFVGMDGSETMPAMWLAGDRNLMTNGVAVQSGSATLTPSMTVSWSAAMHKNVGNVALSDGSVQLVTSAGLQTLFGRTGTNAMRLIVP